jgi:uncharacterized protein YidB (DUF937 family)
MGLLDQVVSAMAGGRSGGNNTLETVMKTTKTVAGGLIQSFQQGGLGDIVNSWVSMAKSADFCRADSKCAGGSSL